MVHTTIYKKKNDEVGYAYLVNVFSTFGSLQKILSDNGTQFKNKLFGQVLPLWEQNRYSVTIIILKAMGTLKLYIIS